MDVVTAPVVETQTADTSDDDPPHIACYHRHKTWCGLDCADMPVVPVPDSSAKVCRVCILAVEVWMVDRTAPCPVCGCRSCIT